MYVPPDEREEYIGEMHSGNIGTLPRENAIRPVHQVREMQLNPNFYQNRNIYPNNIR